MGNATATTTRPLLTEWMTENYQSFFKYSLKHLPKYLGNDEDREDAVSNLIFKMIRTESFEKRLAQGKDLSFSVLLNFVCQMHGQSLDHDGRDMLGRSKGCKTRAELKSGEDFPVLVPDWGGEAVRLPKDQEADSKQASDQVDFVDPSPSPDDMLVVGELWEIIEAGMEREWSGEALARRMRVLKLQAEGGTQGDIEREFGVGPTRAKTFKKEIREVVTHALRPRKTVIKRSRPVKKTDSFVMEVSKPVEQVNGSNVPQFDNLEILQEALQNWGTLPSLSDRQVGYLTHALRAMDLTDENGSLTKVGKALNITPPAYFKRAMRLVFEASVVGQTWLKWSDSFGVNGLDPDSAFDFLQSRSTLSQSTAKRRARTLRYWATFLQTPSLSN